MLHAIWHLRIFFSSFEASSTPHVLMGNNTVMTVCGKGSIDIDDSTFHDVLCVPSSSSNLIPIYQITHSGIRKIVEFPWDSVHIRDSETCNIIAIGIIDHSSYLYSISHFGPPSPLLKNHSPYSWETTKVKLGHLNLCVVPETNVVTSTPPPPI